MTPLEQRQQPRQRLKPEPRPENLVPVTAATLDRLDALIEHLLELRDILDGNPDMEPEHHTGEATFPGHPLYVASWFGLSEEGPGDPVDGKPEPDEDSDGC